MLIEMTVSAIAVDPSTNMPFVVLKDKDEKKTLPIWIGLFEASAIATQLESIQLARPMTHDLLKNVVVDLGGKLERVEITDLRENTFFANLVLLRPSGEEVRIDARPSDAIALALRTGAVILVEDGVLEKAQAGPRQMPAAPSTKDKQKWEEILKNLSPEAFGKYKM